MTFFASYANNYLQKRGKYPYKISERPFDEGQLCFLLVTLIRLGKSLLICRLRIKYHGGIQDENAILEVMHKASVIKIDRACHEVSVVRDHGLFMYESGKILIYHDSRFYKVGISTFGHYLDYLFIGDPGCNDTHAHTP